MFSIISQCINIFHKFYLRSKYIIQLSCSFVCDFFYDKSVSYLCPYIYEYIGTYS